jgi:hypothetical protein
MRSTSACDEPRARTPQVSSEPRDGSADFDFFVGEWKVRNRRLRTLLKGASDWYEFEATSVARKIWNGRGNMDEFDGRGPDGPIQGMTVRLYEPASRQWRLYWANSARGIMDEPVIGRFRDGRGEFFGHELLNGQGILVKYVWSKITPTSCQWEQAFSVDGGRTWETNWVMEFARIK